MTSDRWWIELNYCVVRMPVCTCTYTGQHQILYRVVFFPSDTFLTRSSTYRSRLVKENKIVVKVFFSFHLWAFIRYGFVRFCSLNASTFYLCCSTYLYTRTYVRTYVHITRSYSFNLLRNSNNLLPSRWMDFDLNHLIEKLN